MNYPPTKHDWKPGDLALLDPDSKGANMLTRVLSLEMNGRAEVHYLFVGTDYWHYTPSQPARFEADIDHMLRDPDLFGVVYDRLPGEGPTAFRVELAPGRITARYCDGQPAKKEKRYGPVEVICPPMPDWRGQKIKPPTIISMLPMTWKHQHMITAGRKTTTLRAEAMEPKRYRLETIARWSLGSLQMNFTGRAIWWDKLDLASKSALVKTEGYPDVETFERIAFKLVGPRFLRGEKPLYEHLLNTDSIDARIYKLGPLKSVLQALPPTYACDCHNEECCPIRQRPFPRREGQNCYFLCEVSKQPCTVHPMLEPWHHAKAA